MVTTTTRSRVNGRAVRYTITAPKRKALIDTAGDAACEDAAARRLLYRPETPDVDSLMEHLREAHRLAARVIQHVRRSEQLDFQTARELGGLEAAS